MPNKQVKFTQLYTKFPQHFYSLIKPEPLDNSKLVHINQHLLQSLGLEIAQNTVDNLSTDPVAGSTTNLTEELIHNMSSGQSFAKGLEPLAQKYTGHQFGYYNPNLGDGRGVLLGQFYDANNQPWDLHLKGSGQTPYSRAGDGRAVLRSSVREYLIGEALNALGVPTTRCLSLATCSEQVWREQPEPRASYIRIAKTHIRFGHFEWLANKGKPTDLKALADYVIETVYPELANIEPLQTRYASLLNTITQKTAEMIAAWQTVGFCHGVMNSDNMSVAGETFDFGPYAFLDDCKIHYICNHSDHQGRYAYSQQPNIGLWNCQLLANAFSQLVSAEEIDEAINTYVNTFNNTYLQRMAKKFGILEVEEDHKEFMAETLILLDKSNLDFHYFFTQLENFDQANHPEFKAFIANATDNQDQAWSKWQKAYREIIAGQDVKQTLELLQTSNPKLVLRNYIAQEIIEATEKGDYQVINNWMNWLQTPFSITSKTSSESNQSNDNNQNANSAPAEHYFKPPAVGKKAIILSCSS